MAADRTFKDNAQLQGLQGDAIVDLWILDLEPLGATGANRFIRFCNWVVADGQPVSYASQQYVAIPYKAGGFNLQTEGVPPNPTITLSNVGLEFTGLVNEWNDLIGARITRRRVLARHLDSGSNPDGSAHWPDEVWFVQQKESEQKLLVTFKLSTAFDLDGVLLPRRRALRYTCPWIYRGEGCGYTGVPVADVNDVPLAATADPVLQAVLDTRALIPPARTDMQNAETAYGTAQANTANAQAALTNAQNNLNAYSAPWRFQEERFNTTINPKSYWYEFSPGGTKELLWSGTYVREGDEYRRGEYVRSVVTAWSPRPSPTAYRYEYKIQRWAQDNSGQAGLIAARDQAQTNLTAAQAAEAAAKTVYDTEVADYNTAIANYQAALANWQTTGVMDPDDVCGKRLASCRLRFFDPVSLTYGDLPYGGFPGLTT